MKVLYVASEALPFIKTGGLADVAGNLPGALQQMGVDVTVVLPAYQQLLNAYETKVISYVACLQGYALIRTLKNKSHGVKFWFVDHPLISHRTGSAYVDSAGKPWSDNGLRFGLFCQAIAGQVETMARRQHFFDVVHCNDWQTGLIPLYLGEQEHSPATLFTIHNLAYQGNYPQQLFSDLELPLSSWSPEGVEFYGQLSFIKAGLVYADKINTVSPTYAEEILSEELGYGMSGVLQSRIADLSGIVNGVDTTSWNPASDSNLVKNYSRQDLGGKAANKLLLQQKFSLPQSDELLVGLVARLVEQKGIDLILQVMPQLMQLPLQLVILGTGDKSLEAQLQQAAAEYPQKLACIIGYDEVLAHVLEAGSDVFLMPSKFEPCGLNQMYSQIYGTLPIVTATGGLNDTVIDYDDSGAEKATGFVMETVTAPAMLDAIKKSLTVYQQKNIWQQLQRNAMAAQFEWQNSAQQYLSLYQEMVSS